MVEAYQHINRRLFSLFHLTLTPHPWAEQPRAKHTHAQTDTTQNATNNAIQRREKTLSKKNDSQTGDSVGHKDLQGCNSEARRLYGSPRKRVEHNGPLKEVTGKTEMMDAQAAWLQDLRT
ncbi:uncharacterized protein WM294_003952 [Sarcoramphus papa]